MTTGFLWPRRRPAALLPFVLGGASIASLLLYFYGSVPMGAGTRWILLPALILLVLFVLDRRRAGDAEMVDRVLAGVWAGALATLAYDLVRVPIAVAGVPVFKAISYFGTVIVDQPTPGLASELAGWSYHLSNGIGFGLMYAVALATPSLWTAMAWGVLLEAAMLVTPYAEVFGYRLSPQFLAITIGAHLVYGAVLWAALGYWRRRRDAGGPPRRRRLALTLLGLASPLGIGLVAWDFHARHAASIPPSPPAYLGPHLYVTWNVLEPDRLAALWLMERYVDPHARFHFVEPFTQVAFGRPLDVPEAEIRRTGTRSATEVILEEQGLADDPKLRRLGEMAYLFEIARWRLPAAPEAYALGERLMAAAGDCPPTDVRPCVRRALADLDRWHAETAE